MAGRTGRHLRTKRIARGNEGKRGDSLEVLSIRLTPSLRVALEAETAETGKNISLLAADILVAGLEARRRLSRNNPTQAITDTIVKLAELVCTGAVKPSEAVWRDGPSLFKALRIAVSQFAARPEVPGDTASPMGDATRDTRSLGSLASPTSRAVHAVAEYWNNLQLAAREITYSKYTFNLYELTNGEDDHVYRALDIANRSRQYDFLKSIVTAALSTRHSLLSENIIKALNFHALACLRANAGEYRQSEVSVKGGFKPPESYRVPELMDGFIEAVHKNFEQSDPIALATFVLWRLSNIHPFINGNGRTARAASYFVLCAKAGGWISGDPILPELLMRHRGEYMQSLKIADASFRAGGRPKLKPLQGLITRLLNKQLTTFLRRPAFHSDFTKPTASSL
jgi:hypothetical protein